MKKKNNKIVIILMGGTIVILVVLCVLVATGKISFTRKVESVDDVKDSDTDIETSYVLSESEAEAIVNDLFTNEAVRHIIDNPQLPYCSKQDSESISENDLGLETVTGWIYHKCNSFNSFSEVIENIKTYFTDEYYNNNIDGKAVTVMEYTINDDNKLYYYYLKDGAFYVTNGGKGGNLYHDRLDSVEYDIVNLDSTNITAMVNAMWLDSNLDESLENVTIKLIKENNSWKISSYDVKKS